MSVQFCRGCPYDCEFCNVTALLGHRPRTKTTAQMIAELDRLYALGWRGPVFFVDDNLIGNKRLVKSELVPALIEWQRKGRRIPFNSQVSMNLADDAELMRMMAAAGFDTVFIGIETPDDDALAACNKKQNVGRDLVEDVKRVQRAGIEVSAGFIVGFDGDTPSTFVRQIEFIQRSGIVTAMVGMLQAPSGTRLHARMAREGRLLGDMTGDNVDGTRTCGRRWASTFCANTTARSSCTSTHRGTTTAGCARFSAITDGRPCGNDSTCNAHSRSCARACASACSGRSGSTTGDCLRGRP